MACGVNADYLLHDSGAVAILFKVPDECQCVPKWISDRVCTLFSSFASLAYGRVKTRLDFISILTLIFGLLGVGYVIIGRVQSYEQILIGLAVSGLGLGLLMPNLTVWVSAVVTDALRGACARWSDYLLFLRAISLTDIQPALESADWAWHYLQSCRWTTAAACSYFYGDETADNCFDKQFPK
jgi:MFS family permease